MKKIGGRWYFHKSNIPSLDMDQLHSINQAAQAVDYIGGYDDWNCIRVKYSKYFHDFSEIAFQYSPDFDTAPEPEVKYTIICAKPDYMNNWVIKDIRTHKNTIWHHKWMWVDPSYTGFNVEESKKRSELWKPHVSKSELRKIGNKLFWDSIKSRWEK